MIPKQLEGKTELPSRNPEQAGDLPIGHSLIIQVEILSRWEISLLDTPLLSCLFSTLFCIIYFSRRKKQKKQKKKLDTQNRECP